MKTEDQKRQERGNTILAIVILAIIAIGLLVNFYLK
jgi:hypothetical protein